MATSGTVSTTTFDTAKIIETAVRRCGMVPEQISAENLETARDALHVLLSELPAMGLQLWALDKVVLPCVTRLSAVALPAGTIDLDGAPLFRTTTEVANTGTAPAATTWRMTATGSSTIAVVGLKFSTAGTYALNIQTWDGATATTVLSVAATAYAAGVWCWFDLDPPATATAMQVVESTGATLPVTSGYLGNAPNSVPLGRVSHDDYVSLSDTSTEGRPVQFWLDRQAGAPVMRIWPTPSAIYDTAQIVAWRQRHIQDVGTLQQSLEIPQRWRNAIIARLAARLALELPGVDPARFGILATQDAQAMQIIQNDERDSAPMTMSPNISPYSA